VDRVPAELERAVVGRAAGRCEYCHFPQSAAELPFHVDHVIARKHKGPTESENLAWACFSCNLRKGPNIAGLDPVTGELTRLFHPRKDKWSSHFEWHGPWLRGRTPVGRTTVSLLGINDEDAVSVRSSLLEE
jgi:5-methylcytosine-specific restriction endonuclease McrA